MSYTLYGSESARTSKVKATAKFANVDLSFKKVAVGTETKTPEFLAINPLGQVPVLQTPQGYIRESNAIVEYVAKLRTDHKLLGSSTFENALVNQWREYIVSSLDSHVSEWVLPIFNIRPFKQAVYFTAKKEALATLKFINEHLLSNTYLVGNTFTIADIILHSCVIYLVKLTIAPEVLKQMPHFKRWFTTVANHPYIVEIYGEPVFATAETLAPGQVEASKKEAAPTKKEAAPAKKEAAPKEEKKEAPAPKAEKVVNPLDTLPPTNMKLDDVKRSFFLSRPFNAEFFPTKFWENFDHEGYSIYETEYAYPEDLEKDSYTDNLCTGFLSRCEGTKKWAFACANVVKLSDNQYQIYSAFIVRGPEINAELKDVTDFEEYTFKKLDSKNPEHQQRFNQIFTAEDKVNGGEVIYKRYLK